MVIHVYLFMRSVYIIVGWITLVNFLVLYMYMYMSKSWGERNTAVTQFLETFKERQKTLLFCSFLLHEAELFRTMN